VKVTEFLALKPAPDSPVGATGIYFAPKMDPNIIGIFGSISPTIECIDYSPEGQYEFLQGQLPFLGYVSKFIDGNLKLVQVIVERDG
jgi:hypothetical protein